MARSQALIASLFAFCVARNVGILYSANLDPSTNAIHIYLLFLSMID